MSKRFTHGFVVGKFYPPHTGHLALLKAAADCCDRVTVVVAAATVESLPLADRVSWLGWAIADKPHVAIVGVMDDHPVDYDDPAAWEAHMSVFRTGTDEIALNVPIDAVFTAEAYGDEMARRLGATHVRLERFTSATTLRANLADHWLELVEPARMALARCVVVVGAESTGTTTLANALAAHYEAPLVPEFGRVYSASKLAAARQVAHATGSPAPGITDLTWRSDEFTVIAARQTAAIESAAIHASLVIADTDALATSLWHERYVGGAHAPSLELAAHRPADLYLLTLPDDVAFDQDGLRDGEHVRESMNARFAEVLREGQRPWLALSGSHRQRMTQATRAIDQLLRAGWHFAPPLG